ncbi:MAG: hypothetical protein HY293_07335 [Planctomycetes bacterium]|nr:hypothetical protein [Planctomycetota bacterium]
MSTKGRSTVAALLLFGGLLIAVAAGVTKSDARIQYERDVARQRPDPRVPQNGFANVVMALGFLVAAGGICLIGLSLRDMTRDINAAQSQAEARMRMEVAEKRDPKPKA